MKKGLFTALILVLIAAFVASALYLAAYFTDGAKHQSDDNKRAEMVNNARQDYTEPTASTENVTESPYGIPGSYGHTDEYYTPDVVDEPENVPTKPAVEEGNDFLPWYQELHNENTDMVGWIQIEGTKINYPVMQSVNEPNFYLKHKFDKTYSAYGCPYVQENCDVQKPSDNIIIYGHHMNDGSMFTGLMKYRNKSFWEGHKTITFDTLTDRHQYEVIAVFKTVVYTDSSDSFKYYEFTDAENAAEFDAYVAKCKELSLYDTGVSAEYGDKLISLSTCEYSRNNGRLVVVAKRVD